MSKLLINCVGMSVYCHLKHIWFVKQVIQVLYDSGYTTKKLKNKAVLSLNTYLMLFKQNYKTVICLHPFHFMILQIHRNCVFSH